ncbi:non-specific lipid-transfer protein 1-like [Coffea eugenioides]|uniref:Non-specific lipid-transfer protein n=1 Tax=Coffea arabica TaxID=13443 RepID=A0A6P6XGD6_COFAR|nr:non-specific lipid-transfer protein 1-like [Coffea arabica]XP_027153658.1 non-specific lipid-transfer protein 1-like [Coffea eugenioides]
MANSSGLLKLGTLVIFVSMLIMSFSHGGQAQISCDTVDNDLFPCLSFVLNGGKVAPACCSGIKTLLSLAKTQTDRQSVCSCLKSVAQSATNGQLKNAAQIPHLCGVNLPFQISRNIDCSKVK